MQEMIEVNDDLTVIATADGFLHAIDNKGGTKRWSTDTGGSLASSHHSGDDFSRDFSIVPHLDGSILLKDMGGMRKTSVKARMLVEKAPFVSVDGELLFTGQKHNKILGLDMENGQIMHEIDFEGIHRQQIARESSENTPPFINKSASIWIGRTDYTLRAYSGATGEEQFNLTYSELLPLSASHVYRRNRLTNLKATGSGKELISRSSTGVSDRRPPKVKHAISNSMALYSSSKGDVYISNDIEEYVHKISFASPATIAFRIGRSVYGLADGAVSKLDGFNDRDRRDVRTYDVEPLKVSYRMPESNSFRRAIHETGNDESSLVEIRAQKNGGVYATHISDWDLASFNNRDGVQVIQQRLFDSPNDKTPTSNHLMSSGGDLFAKSKHIVGGQNKRISRIPAHSIRRPQLVSELEAILKRVPSSNDNLADVSDTIHSEQSSLTSLTNARDCIAFPRKFSDSAELALTDTFNALKSNQKSMCLIGRHNLQIYDESESHYLPFMDENLLPIPNFISDIAQDRMPRIAPTLSTYRIYDFYVWVVLVLLSLAGFAWKYYINPRLTRLLEIEAASLQSNRSDEILPSPKSSLEMKATESSNTAAMIEGTTDDSGRKISKVGSLLIYDKVLGYGSGGTIVFSGNLNCRPVAVKRMLNQFSLIASREMSLLIRSDGHPNVVRYFLREERGEFIYLALQLCSMTLRDFVLRIVGINSAQNEASESNVEDVTGHDGVEVSPPQAIGEVSDQLRSALLQIALGIAHLHSQRIVHRDLKPHNILCALPDDTANESSSLQQINNVEDIGNYTLKISDMGLSKQLDRDDISFSSFSNVDKSKFASMRGLEAPAELNRNVIDHENGNIGTIGWQAPELISLKRNARSRTHLERRILQFNEDEEFQAKDADSNTESNESGNVSKYFPSNEVPPLESLEELPRSASKNRRTQTVDIFSLGCVFHYVIVPGVHPFGYWYDRETNILTNNVDLSHVTRCPDAHDLLKKMLSYDPVDRPSASQVCKHPFFWTSQRRLDFLMELSDRLEHEPLDSTVSLALEVGAHEIVGRCWDRRLNNLLLEDMEKYRKYDVSSVRDLLRLLRNKRHHFHELGVELQAVMSPIPHGFVRYFESRFPKLFMHCFSLACQYLSEDKHFSPFCQGISSLYAHHIVPTVGATFESNCGNIISSGDRKSSVEASESSAVSIGNNSPTDESPPPSQDVQHLTDLGIIVVYRSSLADKYNCKGWWRDSSFWTSKTTVCGKGKPRPSHITRSATDAKFRSRLCSHWELNGGVACPMKKKGKCDFAHGPLELRINSSRKDKWGKIHPSELPSILPPAYRLSGGEDSLGSARSIEKIRETGSGQAVIDNKMYNTAAQHQNGSGNSSIPRPISTARSQFSHSATAPSFYPSYMTNNAGSSGSSNSADNFNNNNNNNSNHSGGGPNYYSQNNYMSPGVPKFQGSFRQSYS